SEVKEVNSSIIKLLDNMNDTLDAADGVGLAAPQIGVSKRVIIVKLNGELIELINPLILEKKGAQKDKEGCLSIPNVMGDVIRSAKISLQGLNRQGESVVMEAEGLMARALQHEIDHLDGILFVDIAKKTYRS
ncbi:MAG: peptide deformylase, partial [Desulfosporosinus sp.]